MTPTASLFIIACDTLRQIMDDPDLRGAPKTERLRAELEAAIIAHIAADPEIQDAEILRALRCLSLPVAQALARNRIDSDRLCDLCETGDLEALAPALYAGADAGLVAWMLRSGIPCPDKAALISAFHRLLEAEDASGLGLMQEMFPQTALYPWSFKDLGRMARVIAAPLSPGIAKILGQRLQDAQKARPALLATLAGRAAHALSHHPEGGKLKLLSVLVAAGVIPDINQGYDEDGASDRLCEPVRSLLARQDSQHGKILLRRKSPAEILQEAPDVVFHGLKISDTRELVHV